MPGVWCGAVMCWDGLGDARFLTFSCRGRARLLAEAAVADAFVRQLGWARDRLGFGLVGYVVMPEHAHLLIVPGAGRRVAEVLAAIKRPFAQRVIGAWRAVGDARLAQVEGAGGRAMFWERGGGYDRNVRSERELREKLRYIHENPVRRGLVDRAERWRWSSAAFWSGCEGALLRCDQPVGRGGGRGRRGGEV